MTEKRIEELSTAQAAQSVTVARLEGSVMAVEGDTHDCFVAVKELKAEWREQRDADRQARKDDRKERKSDVKWIVSTIIATGGLVTAALAYLL